MTDTWTWATVTQATPLRIKVDGDTSALDATTDNLVGSLAVDDRVRVHLHSDGIIVTGIQGGAGDGQLPERLRVLAKDISGLNLNDYMETGWYRGQNVINAPSTNWYYFEVIAHRTVGSQYSLQVATEFFGNRRFYRRVQASVWKDWVEIAAYDSDGQLKAADGVADDDVVTVGQMSAGDTGWVGIDFRSGYAEYSSSASYTCQMRRMNGVVYTRGLMKASSGNIAANSRLLVADIPTGYGFEPDSTIFGAGGGTDSKYPATVVYGRGGVIEIRTGGEDIPYLGFGGYSWPAA